MSFDWGLVKAAAEKARAANDGEIPDHFTLLLPMDTTEAIMEMAEDLFPYHNVRRHPATTEPVFTRVTFDEPVTRTVPLSFSARSIFTADDIAAMSLTRFTDLTES